MGRSLMRSWRISLSGISLMADEGDGDDLVNSIFYI